MRHLNTSGFAERRTAAAEAKRQLLAKFASAPKATNPEMQERLAAREAVAVARKARRAERDALKTIENQRLLAEAAAAEIEKRKGAEARVAADEAARKAERDRRYAARKARQA